MAIQTIKYGLPFPAYPTSNFGGSWVPGADVIDAATEKCAIVFASSSAKNIHKIHFNTGTVTTGATVDVRVETVDATTGDPTGTLWAANTNAAVVVASSDDNVWKTGTLTSDATLAVGNIVALVVANAGSGNMEIRNLSNTFARIPYADRFIGVPAWSKNSNPPWIVAEYSDGSFEPIFGYTDEGPLASTIINTSTSTTRMGNLFSLPFPARAAGCWSQLDTDGDCTIKLYDSDGTTVLATTATIDADIRTGSSLGLTFFPFTTTADLAKNTNYRVAIVPTTTTDVTAQGFSVVSAAMMDMFPLGTSCYQSLYTSGSWAETTTSRLYLGLFLTGFDDAVSATGGGQAVSVFG